MDSISTERLTPSTASAHLRMSDTPSDSDELPEPMTEAPPHSARDDERYAHLSLGDGEVVIYDREDPETWLQSDFAVEIGA